jgi:hypothetical protein
MKAAALTSFVFTCFATCVFAKDTKFWNLTANTITSFQLSPVGKNDWGPNQTDNDSDHSVDHDERLKITGAKSGAYDAKFSNANGQICIVDNIQIKEGSIFSIEQKDLRNCTK